LGHQLQTKTQEARKEDAQSIGDGTDLGDACQWRACSNELIRSSAQLRDLLPTEWMRPALGVVTVVLRLPDSGTGDLLGEVIVRAEGRVDGWMLAGGLEAIWEGIFLESGNLELVWRGGSGFGDSWCHVGLFGQSN
jgi:hypothetical protein